MTTTRIYNGTPNANIINNTAFCNGATALYMLWSEVGEVELDFYLQLEITATTNRLIKLNDFFILDTVAVYPIPYELQHLQYNIYGAFITDINSSVEVYAIYSEVNLRTIDDKLTDIQQRIGEGNGVLTEENVGYILDSLAILLGRPIAIGGGGGGSSGGNFSNPLPIIGF
jgi:hypothetical protein